MVYRRRYFEPFVGTTETIGDKSITPDKVDDSAIVTRHLATGAVTSQKIKDGEVKTEDIGAQEVWTEDIKNGAVTESKLADGAVTTYKIGYKTITGSKIADGTITTDKFVTPPITRPITPALDTPEIGDGKVTAAKLAGDAVETAKIKDDAVTSAKIAPDSIQAGDIAANAVEGPEIKNGAVGTDKLSTDAVIPEKLDAINEPVEGDALTYDEASEVFEWVPRLGDDFLAEHLQTRQVFYDDFLGAVLDDGWAQSGTAGGSADIIDRSKVSIHTKAEIAAVYRINWNGKLGVYIGKLPKFYAKFWASNATEVAFKVYVGLRKDAVNQIWFEYDPGVSANWYVRCNVGGVSTTVDTGVAFAFGTHEFYFDVVSAGEVKFYIDGVLKATINTNIPATVSTEPWLEIHALTIDGAELAADKVVISVDPETA